ELRLWRDFAKYVSGVARVGLPRTQRAGNSASTWAVNQPVIPLPYHLFITHPHWSFPISPISHNEGIQEWPAFRFSARCPNILASARNSLPRKVWPHPLPLPAP